MSFKEKNLDNVVDFSATQSMGTIGISKYPNTYMFIIFFLFMVKIECIGCLFSCNTKCLSCLREVNYIGKEKLRYGDQFRILSGCQVGGHLGNGGHIGILK